MLYEVITIPVVRSIAAFVYPNPAQTYITVDFGSAKNKMADIELLDTNGRKVQVVRDLTEQTAGCFTLNINQHIARITSYNVCYTKLLRQSVRAVAKFRIICLIK